MLGNVKVDVIREKSFDPTFSVNVSMETENTKIVNAFVSVVRRPPKVTFTYPDIILEKLGSDDFPKLELEIMNRVLQFIMTTSDKKNVIKPNRF